MRLAFSSMIGLSCEGAKSEPGNTGALGRICDARAEAHLRPALQHRARQPRLPRGDGPRARQGVLRGHARPHCRGRDEGRALSPRRRGAPAPLARPAQGPDARGPAHRPQGRQRGGPRQGRPLLQVERAPARLRRAPPSGPHARGVRSLRPAARALCHDGAARAPAAALRPLQGRACPAPRPFQRLRARRAGLNRLLCRPRLPPHRVHRGGRPGRPHRRLLDAPQGQRARPRLHQRPRPPPAPPRLLGAEPAQHHPPVRRDGHHRPPRQHGARPRPPWHLQRVLPLRARPRRPPHRVLRLRLPDHGPRPRADPLVPARPAAADAVGPAGSQVLVRGRLGLRRRRPNATPSSPPTSSSRVRSASAQGVIPAPLGREARERRKAGTQSHIDRRLDARLCGHDVASFGVRLPRRRLSSGAPRGRTRASCGRGWIGRCRGAWRPPSCARGSARAPGGSCRPPWPRASGYRRSR